MQADTQNLSSLSFGDAVMGANTDDEMIDYEVDLQRDEDYDIDLEHPEAHMSYENEAEGSIVMDDMLDYDQNKAESDNDDVMLDDETLDFIEAKHESSDIHITYEDMATTDQVFENSTETYMEAATSHGSPATNPLVDSNLVEPILEASGPTETGPEEDVVHVEEPKDAEPPQATESALDQTDVHADIATAASVNSDHSSTTLKGEHTSNLEVTDTRSETRSDEWAGDTVQENVTEEYEQYPYPHPVIVSWDSTAVSLFPPLDLWSEDTDIGHAFEAVPEHYFLQDTDACDKTLDQLFSSLREVLSEAVTTDDELWFEIGLLGLRLGEDNEGCKSISLREVLNLHNDLHRQDGTEIPPPVNLALYTTPRFINRLQIMGAILEEGKGLRDCLQLLNLVDSAQQVREEHLESQPGNEDEHHEEDNVNPQTPECANVPHIEKSPDPETERLRALNEEQEVELLDDDDNEEHRDETEPAASDPEQNTDIKENAENHGSPPRSPPKTAGFSSIPVVSLSASASPAAQEVEELLEYEENPEEFSQGPTEKEYPGAGENPVQQNEELENAPQETADSESRRDPESPEAQAETDNQEPEKPSLISVFDGGDAQNEGEYDNQQASYGGENEYEQEQWNGEGDRQADPDAEIETYETQGYSEVEPGNAEYTERVQEHYADETAVVATRDSQSFTHGSDDLHYDETENEPDHLAECSDQADEDNYGEGSTGENQAEEEEIFVSEAVDTSVLAKKAEEEEELIDYEDDEADLASLHRATSESSSTPQKRVRDQDDQESDGQVDENQATKRARAD